MSESNRASSSGNQGRVNERSFVIRRAYQTIEIGKDKTAVQRRGGIGARGATWIRAGVSTRGVAGKRLGSGMRLPRVIHAVRRA